MLSLEVVKPIADANEKLVTVHICELSDEDCEHDVDTAYEILGELVANFSKCREFHFGLSVEDDQNMDKTRIRDICGALPCRGVEVFVLFGNVHYKQKTPTQEL